MRPNVVPVFLGAVAVLVIAWAAWTYATSRDPTALALGAMAVAPVLLVLWLLRRRTEPTPP